MSKNPHVDYWLPDGVSDAIRIANKMWWNLSVKKDKGNWLVYGGDQVIFESNNKETAEAFILGLGVAYAVIPDQIIENLLDNLRPIVD
jgi:hypothetical protein